MNKKYLIMLFSLLILLVGIFGFSYVSNAANPSIFDVSFSLPCVGNTPCPNPSDLPEFILRLYRFGAGIAGILAVGMIVFGAIYRMLNPGSADKQKEGVDMITSAIWGLVLLFGSYLILKTINPRLVILDLSRLEAAPKYTYTRPGYNKADEPCPNRCVDMVRYGQVMSDCNPAGYTQSGKACWYCLFSRTHLGGRPERLLCNTEADKPAPNTADPCSAECNDVAKKYKDTLCGELTGAVSNITKKQCYVCPIIENGAPTNQYYNCYFK